MDVFVWQKTIVNENGDVLPEAEVSVTDVVSGALAQLYSDFAGASPIGNPIDADANGFVQFYVKSGIYDITATLAPDSRTWSDEAIGSPFKRTAAEAAESVVPANYQHPPGHVLRYGTNTTPGTTDMTTAIDAADRVSCAGNLGLDGVTIEAEGVVYFPAGTYKHTGLTYRGAPWVGEGVNTTVLDYYGSGASIDAVGTLSARKAPSISKLTLLGSNASTGGYGIRLGHNYRAFGLLNQVDIRYFPSHGILFDEDCWQLSFTDVYVVGCATEDGAGISVTDTVGTVANVNWWNLQLENCGQVSSSTGGGIHLPNLTGNPGIAINQWGFFGGILQGNKGAAEARFISCDGILLDGVYLESDLAAAGAVDGIHFAGATIGNLLGCTLQAVSSHGGYALRVVDTATCFIDVPWIHSNWAGAMSAEDTGAITLASSGSMSDATIAVEDGASVLRLAAKKIELADAEPVVVNAALGTVFHVTITGGRTISVPTNASVGQRITFLITQDGTGGHDVAFDAAKYKTTWTDTGNSADLEQSISFIYQNNRWRQDGAVSGYYA